MGNLELVQHLYAAFAARDHGRLLALLDPAVEWIQNPGFPDGRRHVGAEAVLAEVFGPFRLHWDGWRARVDRWLDAGDAIVALGEYGGVFRATGRAMTAAFAHVYWVRGGRIVRFEQYTDTAMVRSAMDAATETPR